MAGRTDGLVGGTALLVLLATLATLAVPSLSTTQLAGERTWRPATAAAAERGGTLGMGEGILDLTALEALPAGARVEVPVRVGIGQLVVRAPDGMDVAVRGSAVVGGVSDRSGTGAGTTPGAGSTRLLGEGEDAGARTRVVVDARVLIGEVVVTRVPGPAGGQDATGQDVTGEDLP